MTAFHKLGFQCGTEGLTAHWPIRNEAKLFLGLILRGRMTLAQAKIDILMTQAQFDYLLKNNMADSKLLRIIKARREWTYEELVGMHLQAEAKAAAA